MNDQRPINLNLFTIRQPIPAIVSILHRVSGIVLFLMIPLIICVFGQSLANQDGFQAIHDNLTSPFAKFVTWCLLVPFLYHFVAGIRHLLMDAEIGVELKGARLSAVLTIAITLILSIVAGIYIW